MFSQDNWESTYFKIFWMAWNWPSYSGECLPYWLCWQPVIETSSLPVNKPKAASQYHLLWIWRHIGTRHCSSLSKHTDYENSPISGSKIQYTVIAGHSSQHRRNGRLCCTSWKFWGHSVIGPCGCRTSIQSHCNTSQQSTMTYSIIWMALCEL